MPDVRHQSRTRGWQALWQADEKTNSIPSVYSPDETGYYVGQDANVATVPSFVSSIKSRLTKIVSATLAISILYLLFTKSAPSCCVNRLANPNSFFSSLQQHGRAAASSFLEVFQVYPPVLTATPDRALQITDGTSSATVKIVDSDRSTCQEVLVVHSFAFSYGKPFVGEYRPPACSFNRVNWNLTVVSAGRQYDRLGIVYLGDIEVFRTSTAEPTTDGVEWTYLKDMTSFLALFNHEQKIIFDLGNLVNGVYTAAFNVTLTAAFFSADDTIPPADLILPVSARKSVQNMPSVFTVPPGTASNALTLPRNTKRAVFTIAATGQSEEEFWWSNVLQSDVNTFPQYGELYGYSPFREIQLFVDGMLAGVAWPFPVIFTGGVVPGLWRPIVGIDTFDLKEDEIDISPWLPLLCDGNSHNFTIRVSGLNNDGTGTAVLSETTDVYWLVTGKIFMWLDIDGHITTGDGPLKHVLSPCFHVSSTIGRRPNGTNETLQYEVSAKRSLSFDSTINLSHGKEVASWRQHLTFSNAGNFSDGANVEINTQHTHGYDISSKGYARQFSYPLYACSSVGSKDGNLTIMATVNRGKDVKTLGQPVFPTGLESFSAAEEVEPRYPSFEGAWLSTTQWGTATYLANETAKTSFSFGTTEQEMSFYGVRIDFSQGSHEFPALAGATELFHRYVKAENSTVVEDDETLIGKPIGHAYWPQGGDSTGFLLSEMPGRGKGRRGTKGHNGGQRQV